MVDYAWAHAELQQLRNQPSTWWTGRAALPALALTERIVAAAEEDGLPAPSFYVTPDCGIQIEWLNNVVWGRMGSGVPVDIAARVSPDGEHGVYSCWDRVTGAGTDQEDLGVSPENVVAYVRKMLPRRSAET